MKNLKNRIRQGETLFGCWLNLGSPVTAEIVGAAGFDWVLIDFEHGTGSEKDILHQLQALEHTPAAAIVRVESFQRQRFHRMLDFGAEGIMCPQIRTEDEARQAAAALRYQPEGIRGVAMMVRASGFGADFQTYHANQKNNLIGIVQIEAEPVLNILDAVASIDGIDVLFIGPMDLSMALGTYGQPAHPRYWEAVKAVADAALKAGKAAGILLLNMDDFKRYNDLGYRFIASGSDAVFVQRGAKQILETLRARRTASGK